MNLPTVVTAAGMIPQSPSDLRAQLLASVALMAPGYTADLPGSLIEDISSTDVGALIICDSARVELVNSLTPYGANEALLIQLGEVYGVPQGQDTNTSVFVVFTGTPGFPIARGFTVSDGTNQFIVQDGGIVGSGGSSQPLFAVASLPGSFAVPANTVVDLVTSVPEGITLSVTNPLDGLPAASAQTFGDYRTQLLEAGLASATGMARFLKAQIKKVPGVQERLVSVRKVSTGWEVIVGGGDAYEVANAIFQGEFDLPALTGSTIAVQSVTKANPGVAVTDLNHGLVNGQSNVHIAGAAGGGFTAINGGPYTVVVIDEKTFSFGVDTSGYSGSYTAGSGVVTPNPRNVVVTILDYPDSYDIPFVIPPQQQVAIALIWNTTAVNFVSDDAVVQLGQPAIVDYVNSIPVGVPINLFDMQEAFMDAVSGLIPKSLLSRMVFTVSINSVVTAVTSGTGLYVGDPESYFQTSSGAVSITRG